MSSDDDPDELGYFVVYEDGYKSWSPADVFEKAYLEVSSLDSINIASVQRCESAEFIKHDLGRPEDPGLQTPHIVSGLKFVQAWAKHGL